MSVRLPTLTVIIPTRNRPQSLRECLHHLHAEAARSRYPIEVVVVDTSTRREDGMASTEGPWLSLHYVYDGDIPFSMVRSRNRGLSLARGELAAFLDDDCFVCPGWIDEITGPYEHPGVTAVGGRIVYHPWHKPRVGGPISVLRPETGEIWGEWDRVVDGGPVPVSHLPGGNCSFRRQAALTVGGFDPAYVGSANMEETDFFWRLGRLGGTMLYNSAAVVEHRAHDRTDGIVRSSLDFVYRQSAIRNRLYFLRKTGSGRGLVLEVGRQLLGTVVRTGQLIRDTGVFLAASVSGILLGLTAPVTHGSPVVFPPAADEDPQPGRRVSGS